jgi:hypothetical protein
MLEVQCSLFDPIRLLRFKLAKFLAKEEVVRLEQKVPTAMKSFKVSVKYVGQNHI